MLVPVNDIVGTNVPQEGQCQVQQGCAKSTEPDKAVTEREYLSRGLPLRGPLK